MCACAECRSIDTPHLTLKNECAQMNESYTSVRAELFEAVYMVEETTLTLRLVKTSTDLFSALLYDHVHNESTWQPQARMAISPAKYLQTTMRCLLPVASVIQSFIAQNVVIYIDRISVICDYESWMQWVQSVDVGKDSTAFDLTPGIALKPNNDVGGGVTLLLYKNRIFRLQLDFLSITAASRYFRCPMSAQCVCEMDKYASRLCCIRWLTLRSYMSLTLDLCTTMARLRGGGRATTCVFLCSGEGAHSTETEIASLKSSPSWYPIATSFRQQFGHELESYLASHLRQARR
mmetsp:Transcript_14252/g.36983  ORF Transcript_14252/g.36983 Transcript_14252/m.36983 type:complete len:292 (+) Transcript_14252:213-1088(+)